MPKVTIIIPGYNAEKYVRECLDSVVAQTLDDIEVLLINDGSTDNTGRFFDTYAEKYSFIRVVHQENCGIFQTRAKAIALATGQYIGWVDADDFVASDMFEILYTTALEEQSDLVYCNYAYYPKGIPSKQKWFKPYLGAKNVDYVERNSQFWNKLVKKQLLLDSGICDMLPACFEESMIKVMLIAKNPVAVDRELYFYRIGPGSMSSRYKNIQYYDGFVCASRQLRDRMEKDFPETYWKDYFTFRIAYYQLISLIVAANAGDREAFYRIRRELEKEIPEYSRNQHYWPVLSGIYGKIKACLIGYVVPLSYACTRFMCKFAF